MGTLNGGIVKILSHHELGMALEQRECGIDLGAKLLLLSVNISASSSGKYFASF
jgi:hypothetical protein